MRATILFFRLDFSAAVRILWGGETPVKTASKTGVKIKSYRRKTTISPKKVYFYAHIFFWNCAHLKPSSVDLPLSYIFQKNQIHWPKTLAQKCTSHSSNPRYRYIHITEFPAFPGFSVFFRPGFPTFWHVTQIAHFNWMRRKRKWFLRIDFGRHFSFQDSDRATTRWRPQKIPRSVLE